ncbi:lipopolysaccharide biosynthesis protein [Rhizobacter fulvus]
MVRATLTLLVGSVLAQALPLFLGPLVTRLYTPDQFGHYTAFSAVLANIAVVGCARYEFALPLARDDAEARDLLALCLRVLLGVTLATALGAGLGVLVAGGGFYWLWLPLGVLAGATVQTLTLWATRAQRFPALSASRFVQYGGGAMLQAGFGVAQFGGWGLMAAPVLASALAVPGLARPEPKGGWLALGLVPAVRLREVALRHRDFPMLNTPHAFAAALQDTLAVALLVALTGEAAAGFWGLALRYLKAPASLIGGAVSQALYSRLVEARPAEARATVRQVMLTLALISLPLVLVLLLWGPALFALAFGEPWRDAGQLARALAPYIGAHFVAAPLGVVTLAWRAQGWALRFSLIGQVIFVGALALGLHLGGLTGGAWAVSAAMPIYFGIYFWSLSTWRNVPDVRAN